MVEIATITSKGQVTLPASVRKRMGLRKGTRIVFMEEGNGVRLLREEDLERGFEAFDRMRRDSKLTRKRMDALVKEARRRLWKEHYAAGR